MKKLNSRVYATIPQSLKKQLDEKVATGDATMSDVIYLALVKYLSDVHMDVPKQDKLIGFTMPEVGSVKKEPDPGIKHSFSISDMSGPGTPNKLRSMGVEPIEVIKAKRARSRGVTYDKTLEKYFHLV